MNKHPLPQLSDQVLALSNVFTRDEREHLIYMRSELRSAKKYVYVGPSNLNASIKIF